MSGPQSPLNDMWNAVLARRGIGVPQAPVAAPPPVPGDPGFAAQALVPATAPITIDPAQIAVAPPVAPAPVAAPPPRLTVNSLVDSYIAKHSAPAAPAAPAQDPAAAAEEAYRARQAASYASPEKRAAEAVAAAPPVAPAPGSLGNKYSGGAGAPGGAPAGEPDINWNRGSGGAQTIAAHEVPLVSAKRQDALTAAIDKETGAIEEQKTAIKGSGEASAEVEHQKAIGEQNIAKATEDAGIDTKLRAQAAADESKAYRAHIDDFAKKLADDKIDPHAMYANASTGQNILWTIAKAFGAVQQGFLHLSTNQVADSIEAMAAQDVAAQRANHEIGREHLQDMKSMYAQALQATGDKEQAERVATGYALEAAKHEAAAIAISATSEVQRQKAAELAAQLSERQALVGEKKEEKGIAMNHYAQAQTVGGGPDMKEVYKTARAYVDDQAKLGTVVPPDAAIRWAYKMHTGADPLRGAGSFTGGAKEAPGGSKADQQHSIDEVNRQFDLLDKSPILDKVGFLPSLADHTGFQRAMPESSRVVSQVDKINLEAMGAAGKLLKDSEGRMSPAILEELQKFHIKPGDTKAIAQEKLQGIRDFANFTARQSGVHATEPNAGAPAGFKP